MTAISDGFIPVTADEMAQNVGNAAAGPAGVAINAPTDKNVIPFTTLVVNTGSKLVLLDAGNGDICAPTSGTWMENFKAAGFSPDKVDAVLISHFHGDHINGLRLKDGTTVFPKAEIMVPVAEWSFWMDMSRMASVPEEVRGTFLNARRVFGPMTSQVRLLDWGKEPITGITTVAAPGHTPGHTAFAIASGNANLLVLSDTTNNPQMMLRNPDAASAFDMDSDMAQQSRRRLLDMAATDRLQTAFYHAPFPATGLITKDGDRFRMVSTGTPSAT